MDLYLTKDDFGRFIPAYGTDFDLAKRIKVGETVKAVVTRPRNYGFHKKYFAMIRCFHHCLHEELADRYPTRDSLLVAIKILAGHFDVSFLPDGTEVQIPKSISFGAMDDYAFEEFYSRTLDIGLKYFLRDMDKEEFEQEILNFL